MGSLEVWGGLECTLNRVGHVFLDQFALNGHLNRPEDLDRIAKLGIRKLRYPVHWERVQALSSSAFDWSFSDRQLYKLSELQIEPIVGLLHHGSGPLWTSLIHPDFPSRFAEYALAVATRYPNVREYTPINEPLTTARFSGLYGLWFPHCTDDLSFAKTLLNQIEGIVHAMQAIRTIHCDARLIQTEDIGKTHSTPLLEAQAVFENDRRWLTFDLLAGRFREGHPLWNFILGTGVSRKQVDFILENPCMPDVLGINYYVTSERWLDEDLSIHPPESHGGNGSRAYADVATVRGSPARMNGLANIVREVWSRYQTALAITESHLGCTREEQLRWLAEAWRSCEQLREEKVDLRAITAWALFGSYDWNSLVTSDDGVYEPGAFDVRSVPPRRTATARMIEQMTSHKAVHHAVLDTPGWWRRWAPLAGAAAPILISRRIR